VTKAPFSLLFCGCFFPFFPCVTPIPLGFHQWFSNHCSFTLWAVGVADGPETPVLRSRSGGRSEFFLPCRCWFVLFYTVLRLLFFSELCRPHFHEVWECAGCSRCIDLHPPAFTLPLLFLLSMRRSSAGWLTRKEGHVHCEVGLGRGRLSRECSQKGIGAARCRQCHFVSGGCYAEHQQ